MYIFVLDFFITRDLYIRVRGKIEVRHSMDGGIGRCVYVCIDAV